MPPVAPILRQLRQHANPRNLAGMARYGINTRNALGVSIPFMRTLARAHRRDHELALALWESDVHEARILASLVDDPAQVTGRQMEQWVRDFDSWDICDQVCNNLFNRARHARAKALHWSRSKPEYVRRAGFVLMATLAVHDQAADNDSFDTFFAAIRRAAHDERNFVRKAVNWALRQIGKRNAVLRGRATRLAQELLKRPEPSARWIARDALREFARKA